MDLITELSNFPFLIFPCHGFWLEWDELLVDAQKADFKGTQFIDREVSNWLSWRKVPRDSKG
jgi:hypothetical protein